MTDKIYPEIHFLEDERLSWKAKGILSLIISIRDDLKITRSNILKYSTDGKESVSSGFAELIKFNYLESNRKRNSRGHFVGSYENICEFSPIDGGDDE